MVQSLSGALPVTTLTGAEIVSNAGGVVSSYFTTAQIAALSGSLQVVTAAGTSQGTATAITLPAGSKSMKVIVAVATTVSTKGIVLPSAVTGLTVLVGNNASFGVKVYPALHQFIAAGASNAADTTLAKNKANTYIAASTTKWVVERGS